MGVRYGWADINQIIMNIYLEYPWTWKEYNIAIAEVMPMLGDLAYPCATVVDTTQMKSIPKDASIMQVLLNVEKSMPDNLFASVVVGTAFSIQVFMNILMKLRPRAQRMALFTDTMEEAYVKIAERYEETFPDIARKIDISG